MSWFRGLLPEFAFFCPSPDLRRKLTLAVAFSAFGLVAGASGVALLVAADDSDPRSAFALASPPPPSAETVIATPAAEMPAAETPTAEAVVAQKVAKVEAAKVEAAKVEALPTRQPQVVRAVTAPPATREAPIGHSSEPAEAAPRSATFVANAPPLEEGTVTPTDATAPALVTETPPPPTPAATTRKTARHQGRRGAPYQQFSLWPFGGGGRQRGGFRLFW